VNQRQDVPATDQLTVIISISNLPLAFKSRRGSWWGVAVCRWKAEQTLALEALVWRGAIPGAAAAG
jgi:hypothetical protein